VIFERLLEMLMISKLGSGVPNLGTNTNHMYWSALKFCAYWIG